MENLTTVQMDLVRIDPKEFGIEESKANLILQSFEPLQDRMRELEAEYIEVTALPLTDVMAELKASDLLKKYVKVRTGRNAVHKVEKDFFLNAGRFVDRIKNDANTVTIEREDKLDSIKNHFVNLEIERVKALATSRIDKLKEFEFDGNAFNLGSMEDNTWISFLSVTKMGFEAKKAEEKRLELEAIEKENEAIRERARVEAENVKLKAEAEAKEKELEIERKKQAEILEEIELKAKAEKVAAEAIRLFEQAKADKLLETVRKQAEKAKADADAKALKEKAESDLKLKLEREANDKLKAELLAKEDAERKAEGIKQAEIKAQQEAEKKAEKAPEKIKFKKAIDDLKLELKTTGIDLTTQSVTIAINQKFEGFKKWALEQIETI